MRTAKGDYRAPSHRLTQGRRWSKPWRPGGSSAGRERTPGMSRELTWQSEHFDEAVLQGDVIPARRRRRLRQGLAIRAFQGLDPTLPLFSPVVSRIFAFTSQYSNACSGFSHLTAGLLRLAGGGDRQVKLGGKRSDAQRSAGKASGSRVNPSTLRIPLL